MRGVENLNYDRKLLLGAVMNTNKDVGKIIKNLRKSMGLTQEKLAELVNIDDKHLSKIENGIHLPSYNTLKKISEVLNFNFNNTENDLSVISLNKNQDYYKALKILNSAKTDEEIKNYYDILKIANKLMKNRSK